MKNIRTKEIKERRKIKIKKVCAFRDKTKFVMHHFMNTFN